MTRHLAIGRLAGLLLLGVLSASLSWVRAQDDAFAPTRPARGRADRAALAVPDLRVKSVDPRTHEPVDPRIEAILVEWSKRTKEIQRIQGHHIRAVRDFTFQTETLAQGRFYVETPDKGRIDVEKYTGPMPKANEPHELKAPGGKILNLVVKSDDQPQKWICNGQKIYIIDERAKTYDVVPLPEDQRGANIVDGPLPFLFGMPPEKAKSRYRFWLLTQQDPTDELKTFWIHVQPKKAADAAEWRSADLFLNRKTYLPEEVHLIDPPGTKETIYKFKDIEKNNLILFRFFPGADPFKPVLAGYKGEVHAPGGPVPTRRPTMPLLVGRAYTEIKPLIEKLKQMGYDVKFKHGNPAPEERFKFHVERQQPLAKTPLLTGQTIELTFFEKPAVQRTSKVPSDPPR